MLNFDASNFFDGLTNSFNDILKNGPKILHSENDKRDCEFIDIIISENKGLSKETKICEIFSSLLKGKKAIGYISQINKIFSRFEKTYPISIWNDISIKMKFHWLFRRIQKDY